MKRIRAEIFCAAFAGIWAAACAASEKFCAYAMEASAWMAERMAGICAQAALPVAGIAAVCAAICAAAGKFRALICLICATVVMWAPAMLRATPSLTEANRDDIVMLCVETAARLRAEREDMTPIGDGDALRTAAEAMGTRYPPKSMCSTLMRRLKLLGIYIPFTGETFIDADRPGVGLIFTAAHELAHRKGIGNETAANFAAYTACREVGGAAAYSADLWVLRYARARLENTVWLDAFINEEIMRDLEGISYSGDGSDEYAAVCDMLCRDKSDGEGGA